jgi:CRISPR-associated exonuclease Cas4
MFDEADLIPISAIQHFVFCKRQCALIHVDRVWSENRLTAEGRILHDRADSPGREKRGNMIVARHLPIRSLMLGISGIADVVEYTGCNPEEGASLPGRPGYWHPRPVEYKRGKPKSDGSDDMQLCAQAMCLEEMHHVHIHEADFFYGTPRRRHLISLSSALRNRTTETISDLRRLLNSGLLPEAEYGPKCRSCSLIDACMPGVSQSTSGSGYWKQFFHQEPPP